MLYFHCNICDCVSAHRVIISKISYQQHSLQRQTQVSTTSCKGNLEIDRLKYRLASMGLLVLDVGGGENCQFCAFSQQLFGSPDHHILVQQEAVKYIQSNRERFVSI